MTELSDLDATAQAELVRNGEVSPLELTENAIARIDKLNPELNAVIHPMFEKALAQARSNDLPGGPFRGVPMVLKDLDGHTAGDPFHCGNKYLKSINYTPQDETYSHQKLRSAGFVFVGKTNCPEWGLIPTTESEAYGPTHNPWNTEHSPGGSSGGTAAAVASRMVAIGSGGDGGGSIRIPASECGLVGMKPSRGRVSLGPDLGLVWEGLVVRGCLTRSVRDSAASLDVMSGAMPGDPVVAPPPSRPFIEEIGADPGGLRIGFVTEAPAGMATTTNVCIEAVHNAAKLLESLGHSVEDTAPELNDPETLQHAVTLISTWARWELADWGRTVGHEFGPDDVEPGTWAFANDLGGVISGHDYITAVEALRRKVRETSLWWEDYDILVTPTIAEPPPKLGEWESPPDNPLHGIARSTSIVAFVAPFNVSGQPAISLPLHWSDDGLPIGVQLIAAYGREDVLFRLAAQLEEASPWADKRPPVS